MAEQHRIEGEVRRAARHPVREVKASFESALEGSRGQGARMFELRAATSIRGRRPSSCRSTRASMAGSQARE
jgi:hypothetical protein